MSNFQIILIAILVAVTIVAVLIFAGIIPLPGGVTVVSGTVSIWGTVPNRDFLPVIEAFRTIKGNERIAISYTQKSPDTFDEELTSALARGTGPDVILLPSDSILKHQGIVLTIPYTSFPLTAFKDSFISAADIFLTPEGTLALPLFTDPLVMYYNRAIFDDAGVAQPPQFWDEFGNIIPSLTRRQNSTITRSGVALGGAKNIPLAKEIISALTLQAGNAIVSQSPEGGAESVFSSPAAQSALSFYASFANPTTDVYSWNESLPNARQAFLSGNLAIYFGLASELFQIRDSNPNLDFDVRGLPQVKGSNKATFGKVYGLAITKNSKNVNLSMIVISNLTTPNLAAILANALALPPARRDLLAGRPEGNYLPIFYQSALQSKSWLDPDPKKTAEIFSQMISDVVSGRADVGSAVDDASDAIDLLLARR